MTHQNLVLTEKAIGRHTKRLQKELAKINHDLKLSEAQNMLSRILGMKDYHELKQVLKFENEEIQDNEFEHEPEKSLMKKLNSAAHAKQNLEKLFEEGSIHLITHYYYLNNKEIIDYLKEHAFNFLKLAIYNRHNLLIDFLLQEKLIVLENLSEEEIGELFYYLIHYNFKKFEYIFYTLNFPKEIPRNLKQRINSWLNEIIKTKNIKSINRFLNDLRVSQQIEFYPKENPWRESNYYCTLNQACLTGSLEVVKYFIEQYNLTPELNGSTIQNACISGNLNLVKYLIEDKKANYHYFHKERYGDFMDESLKNFTFPSGFLDDSTLASAVNSDNIELIKYLILNKNLQVEEYDYLALKTALINNCKSYSYLITLSECTNYLKNNAQDIFNKVIVKRNLNEDKKNKNKNKIQVQIAKYLYENYNIELKEIKYESNNPELINYLKKIKK